MAVAALALHPDPAGGWVDAHPFRAHVRHLMAAGDLTGGVVAQLAGVSPRAVQHLLAGRGGGSVRRISPVLARRLYQVTAEEARAVHYRLVPAATAARRLRRLLAAGWRLDELASLLGVRESELGAVAEERVTTCSQVLALRVAAEAYALASRAELLYRLPQPDRSAA